MEDKHNGDDLARMLRGVPPKNILISFNDKPPKSLAEHMKDQRKKRKGRDGR